MAAPARRRHTFAARYATLSVGEALSKVCVLAAFAYLARVLGPIGLGFVELSVSVTVVFALAVEAGLGSYGARNVAVHPEESPRLLGRIIALRTVLALIAYPLILAISLRYGEPGAGILAIYGLTVFCVPFYTQWVCQGLERMPWVAGATLLRNLVFVSVVLLFVRPGRQLWVVGAAEMAGLVALVAFNLGVLRRVLHVRIAWAGAWRGAWRTFRETWAFGASELSWAALWYAPVIWLGLIDSDLVAWLAGPLRVVMALHTFVFLYFFSLLPRLSRSLVEGHDHWRDLTGRSLATSMWSAGLLTIGVSLVAPLVVRVVYGPGYEPAETPLRLLIWMIPLSWLSGHFRYTLIAMGRQRLEFQGALLGALSAIVLTPWLARQFGASGAAVGLLAGGLVNAGFTGWTLRQLLGPLGVFRPSTQPLVVGVVSAAGALTIAPFVGSVPATLLASLVYGTVAVRRDTELARLGQAWLRR